MFHVNITRGVARERTRAPPVFRLGRVCNRMRAKDLRANLFSWAVLLTRSSKVVPITLRIHQECGYVLQRREWLSGCWASQSGTWSAPFQDLSSASSQADLDPDGELAQSRITNG